AQDSSGGDLWAVITEPLKTFDLLALQQGTTALLGQGEMPAGRYQRVRMTIDTSLSSITWNDAAQTPAHVNWYGRSSIYASVEYPVDVPTEGADIVLDFDVGRSFLYNFSSNNNAFDFNPILRAINSAAVGAIAGTVTQDSGGTTRPVPNAPVDVYTDSVGDNNGNPVYTNPVTWTSSDPTVATVQAPGDTIAAQVTGRQPGIATIRATSGSLTDSLVVHVVAFGSLATVTIEPASATITVG